MIHPMVLDLAHAEQGEGPPVVILHGLFGAASNWTSIARRLAASRRVFALDLRNHGASPWSEDMSYDAMAADVAGFIRTHGPGPAVVIGHSMGGKAAMVLALRQGELVERLVVADVAPAAYPPLLRGYAEAMRAIDPRGFARRNEADALLRGRVADDGVRQFLLQNLVQGPDGLRWRLNLDILVRRMEEISDFPEIPGGAVYRGPTLFLRGERSDYVQDSDRAEILRLFPQAEIVTIPGAGHWLHAEQPDAFVAAVERLLTSN